MPNPNYQYSHANAQFLALAIEQVVNDEFTDQMERETPLLSAILRNKQKFGRKNYERTRNGVLVRVAHEDVAGITPNTLGVHPSQLFVTAMPAYQQLTGYTNARFEITHMQYPLQLTKLDMGFKGAARGNAVDLQVTSVINKIARTINEMISGNQSSSATQLQGLQHALATGNTVGGISQATNPYWRAIVATGTGTLTDVLLNGDRNRAKRFSHARSGGPDIMLADCTEGGFDVYGKLMSLIPQQNLVQYTGDFSAKFGVETFVWRGMEVVMDSQGAGGTYKMLNSRNWVWVGDTKPQMTEMQRIPGSTSYDVTFHMASCLAVDRLNNQVYRTGISA